MKKLLLIAITCSMVTAFDLHAAKKDTSKAKTKDTKSKSEIEEYFSKVGEEYKESSRRKISSNELPKKPSPEMNPIPANIRQEDGSIKAPYPEDSLVTDMRSIKEIVQCTAPNPQPISDIIRSEATQNKKK